LLAFALASCFFVVLPFLASLSVFVYFFFFFFFFSAFRLGEEEDKEDKGEISKSLIRSLSIPLLYFVFFGGGESEEELEDSLAFESYL